MIRTVNLLFRDHNIHYYVYLSCTIRTHLAFKGKLSSLMVFKDTDFWFVFCCCGERLLHDARFAKQYSASEAAEIATFHRSL